MAPRKRNPNPHRPSAAAPAKPDEPPPPPPAGVPIPIPPEIKTECDRALTALRRGNHTKALRLMKDATARHLDAHPILHRVHGTVALKVASLLDDPSAKLRHLRLALDSARRAAALSPSSLEFAHFHASLLYEAASDSDAYDAVVHECERALAIPDPFDPARDSLDHSNSNTNTADERINHLQQELRALIQKANIASITSWMKALNGNGSTNPGEEKFHLIPMRRLPEEPMEVCLVPSAPRSPNEIKKATKTIEERRKEIEVRVAAARLLQQKPDSASPDEDGTIPSSSSPSTSSSSVAHRLAERRKLNNSRKLTSSADRMDQVRAYWNAMSPEQRKGFLVVSIADLRTHHSPSPKDSLASDILSEALTFVADHGTWKFWACCRCGEKSSDAASHTRHVVREHVDKLRPKLRAVIPRAVDGEWIEMLVNGSWKPIDFEASMEMLKEEDLTFHSTIKDDESDASGKDKDSLSEYWSPKGGNSPDSSPSPQKESSEDGAIFNGFAAESRDTSGASIFDDASRKWPLADDMERSKLLDRIQGVFQSLVNHKSLSIGHLQKVIQFAMDEIQSSPSGSLLLNQQLDQSPLCICFLSASQLRKVLNFLQELWQSCGVGRYSEKDSTTFDAKSACLGSELLDGVRFASDSSSLLLDGCIFDGKNDRRNVDNSCINEVSGSVPDANALVSWLFSCPSCMDQLSAWIRMREEKSHQGMEILQLLEKEFYLLQSMCERKSEHLSYKEALQTIEGICADELRKREHAAKFTSRSYEAVLRKHQDELIERENGVLLISSRFELDAISNVLKEAQSLNVSQFGYDENISGVTSRLCELESVEDDDWRANDCFHQADSCVDMAIQRQKEHLVVELNKIDAKIMRSVTGMQQLELKLGPASDLDYRTIVLPLVKSFLRAHLEDLVEKDATEKSDAAREAFLAELALDSKKTRVKEGDSKPSQEKSKDKKKNKDNRKFKDMKVMSCNEHPISLQEATEQPDSLADGNHTEPELISSDDYWKQQEELRRKLELEAEERKLEETLEYQRRIENEAKQKHLAELLKNTTGNSPDNVSDETCTAGSDLSADYLGQRDVSSYYNQATLPDNTSPNILNGITLGDFHYSEPVTQKSHQNVEFDRSKVASTRSHLLQNLGNQQRVDNFSGNSYETYDIPPLVQNTKMPINLEGMNINGGMRTEAPAKSSSNSLQTNNSSSGQLYPKQMQGDNGAKALLELHAGDDDDDDERFQEDLKKAVRQSLESRATLDLLPRNLNTPFPQPPTLGVTKMNREIFKEKEQGRA